MLQMGVGGVDNGIDIFFGQVALDNLEAATAGAAGAREGRYSWHLSPVVCSVGLIVLSLTACVNALARIARNRSRTSHTRFPVFANNPVSEFIINLNQEVGGEIMESHRRTNLLGGIVLILVGGILLAAQLFPGLGLTLNITFSWPLILVGVGILLLLLGLLVNEPGMAVPACIVAGIGGILYYQNATGDWASWAYAWALIPGFVGVGTILAGPVWGKFPQIAAGWWHFDPDQRDPVCHLLLSAGREELPGRLLACADHPAWAVAADPPIV